MDLQRPTPPDPYTQLPGLAPMTLTSKSFTAGAYLPEDQAYAGGNRSPQLSWHGTPAGTASFLMSCFDPDAPTPSGFWHWCVANIPVEVTDLVEGSGAAGATGVLGAATTLVNDYGTADYGGAAPPLGDRAHRYIFAVTALDVPDLGVDSNASLAKAHFMALEHMLARATLTGLYQL